MNRSANKINTDWRREWDEEQTLTVEEQKESDRLKRIEKAQTAQILEDLRMMEMEEEEERAEHQRKVRHAKEYLKERGWSDAAIWVLSDTELLEVADALTEKEWEEDIWDYEVPETEAR